MYPTQYINNWDLVDLSSHEILGTYLLDKPEKRNILISLAKSKSLWERRIAMVACYALLRKNQFDETFAVSEILLHDEHDLIHKAIYVDSKIIKSANLKRKSRRLFSVSIRLIFTASFRWTKS